MRHLDFMLIPKGAVVRIEHSTTDLSDHEALVGEIVLPRIDRPRNLRVINRKVADKVTALALANADCASEFLFNVDVCRRRNKSKLDVVLNRRQVDRKLFLALARERKEETRVILNKYWESLIEDNENMRYSIKCKEALKFLSKVFKYNQFEKRDGAIVSCVKVNGEVIKDDAVMNKLIMDHLKKVQVNVKFPIYHEPVPFPKLPVLTEDEMKQVLEKLWPGKLLHWIV